MRKPTNQLTDSERRRVMHMVDADKIRVMQDGAVHTHGSWPRGDGGAVPWWRFEGYIEDVRRRLDGTGF